MPGPLALVSAYYGRQQAVLQALGDGRGVLPGIVTPAQLAQLHRQIHAHTQLLITARFLPLSHSTSPTSCVSYLPDVQRQLPAFSDLHMCVYQRTIAQHRAIGCSRHSSTAAQVFAHTARDAGHMAVAARQNDLLYRLQKFREDQLQARQACFTRHSSH